MSDVEQRDALYEQCNAASENLSKKRKDIQNFQREYEEDMRRFTEIRNKIEILDNQEREILQNRERTKKELMDQEEKKERAFKSREAKFNNLKSLKVSIDESNPHITQMHFDIENNLSKTLFSSLYALSIDFPEMGVVIDEILKENKISMPTKPPSSIDTQSVKSNVSGMSGRSMSGKSSVSSKNGKVIKK